MQEKPTIKDAPPMSFSITHDMPISFIIMSFRYALGRLTHVAPDTATWLEDNLSVIPDRVLAVIQTDLDLYVDDFDPDIEQSPLGDRFTAQYWINLHKKIKQHREENPC